MSLPRLTAAALAMAAALMVAGLGAVSSFATAAADTGGVTTSAADTQATGSAATATASAAGARVSLGHAAGVGKVLVDGKGKTLYLFEKDRKGSGKSTCGSACAKAWPPLTTNSKPVAGSGVTSSKLGTIKRADGTTQVTYNGWPLYGFIEDKKAGEANGTGVTAFGGAWFPLHSSGTKAG
ncbi:MAG: COG4315 family predicted lipoprotein [Solirubrobacterales bacterium]